MLICQHVDGSELLLVDVRKTTGDYPLNIQPDIVFTSVIRLAEVHLIFMSISVRF